MARAIRGFHWGDFAIHCFDHQWPEYERLCRGICSHGWRGRGRGAGHLGAQGLGKVTYSDVRLSGLPLPREVAFGLAWEFNEPLLLWFKPAWLDSAEALKDSRISARNPDNPSAPAELVGVSTLNWRDQYVIALGMAYCFDWHVERLGGYNIGRGPVPAEQTQPLMAATSEHHVTLGLKRSGNRSWQHIFSVEYQPWAKARYSNPEPPFGPDSEIPRRHAETYACSISGFPHPSSLTGLKACLAMAGNYVRIRDPFEGMALC